MFLTYNNDFTSPKFGTFDIDFKSGDPLSTAVLLSLFTWRRCRPEETDINLKRYGWWADKPDQKIGSKLWLLKRTKNRPGIELLAKEYVRHGLQWIIDDGIAAAIEVDANRGSDWLEILINIKKHDGSVYRHKFDNLWNLIT